MQFCYILGVLTDSLVVNGVRFVISEEKDFGTREQAWSLKSFRVPESY